MTLGRDKAKRLLTPHAGAFVDMYRAAIADMKACGLFPFKKRATQASVLSDVIARKLEQMGMAADALPGVTVRWRNGSPRVIIAGALLTRFKKAGGPKKVGQNILTRAEQRFVDPLLSDSEFPHLAKIEIVYTLDRETQDLIRLEAISRNGDDAAWRIDLLDMARGTLPLPFLLPPPADDIPKERRARVVLKKGNAKDRGARSA